MHVLDLCLGQSFVQHHHKQSTSYNIVLNHGTNIMDQDHFSLILFLPPLFSSVVFSKWKSISQHHKNCYEGPNLELLFTAKERFTNFPVTSKWNNKFQLIKIWNRNLVILIFEFIFHAFYHFIWMSCGGPKNNNFYDHWRLITFSRSCTKCLE